MSRLAHEEDQTVNSTDTISCPLCGGARKAGATTFAVELGFGVVVIRSVPATVCEQCGADWIADEVAARLEEMVATARERRHQVEVTAFAA